MPFLSPAKLLVVLVVALFVLGPDRLPKVARQVGGLWRDLRALRQKLEADVRGSFPDLPSSETVSRAVRSPLSFLDDLADSHDTGPEGPGTATHEDTDGGPPVAPPVARPGWPAVGSVAPVAPDGGIHGVRPGGPGLASDPGMN